MLSNLQTYTVMGLAGLIWLPLSLIGFVNGGPAAVLALSDALAVVVILVSAFERWGWRWRRLHPHVIGIEAAASPVFTSALAAGRLVEVDVRPTVADGLAGNAEPGSMTFDLIRDMKIPVHAVGEDAILAAMRGLIEHEDQVVEGAGAVGVAALLAGLLDVRGERIAIVVSGGNVDPGRLRQQEPGAKPEQDQGEQGPQHG